MTGEIPLIVLLGPTAVGKTRLALEAAQSLGGEIVGADSRQVYRFMDVGTAKPTPEQRALVPHHLLDVVNPNETLSLAEYQRTAYAAIDDIRGRGQVPLLVGGTGQYITAVVEGWKVPAVSPNEALRAELEAFAAEQGAAQLHERLRALDPSAADRIDYRNVRRVVRALEIALETGEPMDYEQRKQPPSYPVYSFGLTMDRTRLYERADRRIDAMIADGFVDEVKRLRDMGYDDRLPSMSALGYRQMTALLRGELALDEAVAATRTATHDFIRKQYTWFTRHNGGLKWLDVEMIEPRALVDAISTRQESSL